MTIDDALMHDLREAAKARGLSLKELVNRALRAGLTSLDRPPSSRPYRGRAFAMGRPHADLEKALLLAGALEDEEIVRKAEFRMGSSST